MGCADKSLARAPCMRQRPRRRADRGAGGMRVGARAAGRRPPLPCAVGMRFRRRWRAGVVCRMRHPAESAAYSWDASDGTATFPVTPSCRRSYEVQGASQAACGAPPPCLPHVDEYSAPLAIRSTEPSGPLPPSPMLTKLTDFVNPVNLPPPASPAPCPSPAPQG